MNVDNRRTLMPTSSVAVGSWLAPMIARPRLVRVKNNPSNTASTARVRDQPQPLIGDVHAEDR